MEEGAERRERERADVRAYFQFFFPFSGVTKMVGEGEKVRKKTLFLFEQLTSRVVTRVYEAFREK